MNMYLLKGEREKFVEISFILEEQSYHSYLLISEKDKFITISIHDS